MGKNPIKGFVLDKEYNIYYKVLPKIIMVALR
jgi:hypothetical protein